MKKYYVKRITDSIGYPEVIYVPDNLNILSGDLIKYRTRFGKESIGRCMFECDSFCTDVGKIISTFYEAKV